MGLFSRVPKIKGNGFYLLPAVGTYYYQSAFPANTRYIKVMLELEDDNPYDSQAVRVTLRGNTLGYLSRENARTFRCLFHKEKYQCDARIIDIDDVDYDGHPIPYQGLMLDI